MAAELARYAKNPAPDVVLVLTHAGGAKGKELLAGVKAAGARVIECPKLTRFAERLDFIRAEFRRAGRRADDGAARALLDAVGSDLRELAAACGQLAADTDGKGWHRRGGRGQVLPGPGRGDRVHRRRPCGRGAPRPGARATALGAGDGRVPGADLQRARPGGTPARPGRIRAPRRQQRGARGRGRRPAVEDRPGPAATARLAPERHRPGAARGRRSGRAGQGRSDQRGLRAGTSGAPDRRQPELGCRTSSWRGLS